VTSDSDIWPPAASSLKNVGGGVARRCNFPTDSWKISHRGSMGAVLKISVLSRNLPQDEGFSAPNLHFLAENFPTRIKFFDRLKLGGEGGNSPMPPPPATTSLPAADLLSSSAPSDLPCRVLYRSCMLYRRTAGSVDQCHTACLHIQCRSQSRQTSSLVAEPLRCFDCPGEGLRG